MVITPLLNSKAGELAEISTAKILKNGEVKMKIPKSNKVTLRRLSVITQSLRKSRRDLDTDIHHPKSFCCTFKTSPLYG
jgi:hypothetical protein